MVPKPLNLLEGSGSQTKTHALLNANANASASANPSATPNLIIFNLPKRQENDSIAHANIDATTDPTSTPIIPTIPKRHEVSSNATTNTEAEPSPFLGFLTLVVIFLAGRAVFKYVRGRVEGKDAKTEKVEDERKKKNKNKNKNMSMSMNMGNGNGNGKGGTPGSNGFGNTTAGDSTSRGGIGGKHLRCRGGDDATFRIRKLSKRLEAIRAEMKDCAALMLSSKVVRLWMLALGWEWR